MLTAKVTRSSDIVVSPRVQQMSALFDVQPTKKSEVSWDVALPIDERPWTIGMIVGPSGAGKSTVARELFGDQIIAGYDWPKDRCILDAFPADMGIRDVTGLLCSVGFGSAPNWMRPFHVLSNGEQFRTTMARAMAESGGSLIAVDEFTSVVDRAVAKVASHSIQKAVRKRGGQLVAIGCHYDVIEWLQPDWVYEPHSGAFEWRSLQRRPEVAVEIRTASKGLWPLFAKYHYLSGSLATGAKCIAAFLDDRPIAFSAVRKLVHPKTADIMLGHRLVVLPDYQGLGIGGVLDDWMGQYLWERGWRYNNVVSHPAMIAYYGRSPRWQMQRSGRQHSKGGSSKAKTSLRVHQQTFSLQRSTTTFTYTAPAHSVRRPPRPQLLTAFIT